MLARWTIALALGLFAGSTFAGNATVNFACCEYVPATVTIQPGDSVTWNGFFPSHPILQVTGPTSDTAAPGGFSQNVGNTFTQVFTTPGTYHYICVAHGQNQFGGTMRGTVIVSDALFVNGFEP
jgi:plastocyanin